MKAIHLIVLCFSLLFSTNIFAELYEDCKERVGEDNLRECFRLFQKIYVKEDDDVYEADTYTYSDDNGVSGSTNPDDNRDDTPIIYWDGMTHEEFNNKYKGATVRPR